MKDSAFEGTGITSIAIPASVSGMYGIDDNCFKNCANLASVTWERNAEGKTSTATISGNAFYDCPKLKNMIIPSTVTLFTNALRGFGADCTIYFMDLSGPSPNWNLNHQYFDGCNAKMVWYWSEDMGFLKPDGTFEGETSNAD